MPLKLKQLRQLLLIAFLFSAVCLGSYIRRQDYYHKQTDQFYYLSLADSLRNFGVMRERIDFENSFPPSANTGVSLLMLPFSKGSLGSVFIPVSVLYFLFHLSTVFPLFYLLRHFKVKNETIFRVLAVYFASFPITMFGLWPVNEGASLGMISWFLYFIFVRPRFALFLPLAFVAPIFRVHVLLLEIAIAVYSGISRQSKLFLRALASMGASLCGMALYRALFPYFQKGIGSLLKEDGLHLVGQVFSATTHLIIPETLSQAVFHGHAPQATGLIGGGILLLTLFSFYRNLKSRRSTEVNQFGLCVLLTVVLSLFFSVTIIARYFTPAYFWIVLAILIFAEEFHKPIANWVTYAWVGMNILVLSAYSVTGSTDPAYAQLEDVKALSSLTPSSAATLFYDADFPVHERQIYGYFRRPSGQIPQSSWSGKFELLTLHPEEYSNRLSKCQMQASKHGTVSLLNVDCP